MKLARILLAVPALLATSCAQQICEKEFACQDELGIEFDDDYVDICVARREGDDKVLRANAEPECSTLADAELKLATCEAVLSCEDLATSRSNPVTDDDKCKDLRKEYNDALEDADFTLACNGVVEPVLP